MPSSWNLNLIFEKSVARFRAALIVAAEKVHVEILKVLLHAGADLNAADTVSHVCQYTCSENVNAWWRTQRVLYRSFLSWLCHFLVL